MKYMLPKLPKIAVTCAALIMAVLPAMAQTAADAAPQKVTSPTNLLAYLLVATAVILAIIVWGLGKVLIVMGRQVLEKSKAAGTAVITILLVLMAQLSFAQTPDAAAPVEVVPNYGGLNPNEFYLLVLVIIVEVCAILFLGFGIRRMYQELLPGKAVGEPSKLMEWWNNLDKKIFTKAVPVEKEADVLLDHDYDGIKELDNALPPWWKYGFYITIAVAFVYIINFHVMGSGKNPSQEYLSEMEKARVEKEAYDANNKDKIDEKNVPMADATGIATGKEIYGANCVACHGKLGEGGAGPNLTDNFWIHKGSLNDIYNTLKVGYADKGMQSWAGKFSPKEMSQIASYVKTLKGTNPPNPKAAQGDLYTDAPVAKPDSVVVKADSIAVVKTK
ncbi:MAG: cbb3-type cytochrome c oxidase N-terminal domain-containing protein [Ferruginibacter sp.]